ncbi:hypothetical protein HMPREF0178_01922 [Bilophila sp. 4_1_30]|nr:hypothetical protein HMPREF0178_01922 [Bilophila sp. 4_1_30]
MHVERLFQIVFLLMSGSCGTAKELAEHCSVSVRTIQRDLDALSLAGIPIFSNRGRGGGTGLLKEFTLDKTFMTEQEQADILHGLQALEGAGYPGGNAALHKLAALFRKKAEDRWLRVDFSSWCGSGFGKEKFHRLKEAILAKKVIRFTYFSSENRVSERFAEPLCLLFRERAWYVCVFDRKKSREMVLRASRIRDLHVMEEMFERTMQEDPMATPDYSKSYALQRVVLRIDAECAFRAFDEFPEQDIRPQPDGSFLIDEEMPINEWLTGYLLSFADGLERKNPFHAKEI